MEGTDHTSNEPSAGVQPFDTGGGDRMETHHQADLELSTVKDEGERHDRSLTYSPNHSDNETIGWVMGTRMEEEEEEEDVEEEQEEEEEESHVHRRLYGLPDEYQRISLVLSDGHGLDDETDVDLLETSEAGHTLRMSEGVRDSVEASVKDDGKDAPVNLRAQERESAGKLSPAPVKPPLRKKSPARPRDNPPPVDVGVYEPMWEANSQRDKLSVHDSSVKTQNSSADRGSVLADDDQQPSTSHSEVTALTSRTRTKSGSSQNKAHEIELSSPIAGFTDQSEGEVTTMTNHRRESGGVEEKEEVGGHGESLSQSLSNGAQSLKPYTDFVDVQRLLSDQSSWDQKKEDSSDVLLGSIFSRSPATVNTKQLKKLLRLGTWHPGATLRNKAWQWLCVYRMHKLESFAFYKNSVHEVFPGRCVCVT
jgi:hypothetical protein